jgi:CubicO group peptidase (beta-lactamase class C family)
VTWHNGGTGGFTAFLGIDRERGTGVVILSARQEPPSTTTRAGFALLDRIADCA